MTMYNSVQNAKEKDLQRLIEEITFDDNKRPRFNHVAVSKNVPQSQVWEQISKKLKDVEANYQKRVSQENSEKIMRHISEFKTKGNAKALGMRQFLREWRDICRIIRNRENKNEHNHEEMAIYKELGVANLKSDNNAQKRREGDPASNQPMVRADDNTKGKKDTPDAGKGGKKNEWSTHPPEPLLQFIPYCNDIIKSGRNDTVDKTMRSSKKNSKKEGK